MRFPADLEPKLVTVLREGYGSSELARDALAGVVVAIVALPLAIAFAIASGVRPEQGIYTAVVAGFLISAFGGSRVQIGGPTGAFVVLVADVVARFGYEGLALATLIAGALLVVMALARLGDVIRFVPYPVTVGFTTGIALIIALGQVRDALGLAIDPLPAEFWARSVAYVEHVGSTNPAALGLCTATVLILWLWPRVSTRIPGPLVALVVTSAAVRLLDLDVETIGSRFGDVSASLPAPHLPEFELERLPELLPSAVSIALLGAIESLLSAIVSDGLTGGRHRSNAELLAQGLANLAAPLCGGIPATGAIARTATNVRNGGRSPVAGIVHALTLAFLLLVAGPLARGIPMAALAGILLVVAYGMSEWRSFGRLLSAPRSDSLVLITTFLLTVIVDLTVAIQAGVVLAALLFMRRMAEVTQVRQLGDVVAYEEGEELAEPTDLPPGIEVFEIHGSFCFGAALKFTETLAALRSRPRVVILRMRHVLAVDATGLHALEDVHRRLRQQGTLLFLSGVHAQPLVAMQRSGTLDRIGLDHCFDQFEAALERAQQVLD